MGSASATADSRSGAASGDEDARLERVVGRVRVSYSGWFRSRPGLPVTSLGVVYVVYGLLHMLGISDPAIVDVITVGLLEIMALGVVYGGYQTTARGSTVEEGFHVTVITYLFGFIGFVIAASLIALEAQRQGPVSEPILAIAMASVTTSAMGSGLALYYIHFRTERDRVEELNKRLTVLHRVLRHNLRNEVTVLRGYAELLLSQDPTSDSAGPLRTIVEHANRVEELSQNAYRLRQVWNEEAVVDQEVTELVELAVRTVEASHPQIDIEMDLPTRAVARAHPRLQLAVQEAIRNAVVHNDPESVGITASVARLDGSDPIVEITVSDTGRGISDLEPAVLEQVGEGALKHGTGLGLWLIYWIVEQSDGELRFEDNDPQGTIVKMRLPAADN